METTILEASFRAFSFPDYSTPAGEVTEDDVRPRRRTRVGLSGSLHE